VNACVALQSFWFYCLNPGITTGNHPLLELAARSEYLLR
jgi:hypothetical protein